MSSFDISGPGMLPGAELPDVAGDDEHHCGAARVNGLMKIVTGPFAIMNRGGLDLSPHPVPTGPKGPSASGRSDGRYPGHNPGSARSTAARPASCRLLDH